MSRMLVVLLVLAAAIVCVRAAHADPPAAVPPIEVRFSPNGGCMDAILREIAAAKREVLVEAYWFTSARMADALVQAHKRGIEVRVILDASRTQLDDVQADVLANAHVPLQIDDKHVTAHNKLVIVDGGVVITGSFNFTEQSETENAENLLIIRDKAIAEKYTANWKSHAAHSPVYGNPATEKTPK
jgi:phosphatidylserine/phosphatidylglycerophosphate/cardiolipin synthase-like enzyme